jgi:methyltransferase (TIGR00027 family)
MSITDRMTIARRSTHDGRDVDPDPLSRRRLLADVTAIVTPATGPRARGRDLSRTPAGRLQPAEEQLTAVGLGPAFSPEPQAVGETRRPSLWLAGPVGTARASMSARQVVFVRAALAANGWVGDDRARRYLPTWLAWWVPVAAWALRSLTWPVSFPAYLTARTRFFDDAVRDACDEGVRAVVVLGAGYDTLAERLAREGVRYFEVDQPATQALKRALCPSPSPAFVGHDLNRPGLVGALEAAGWDRRVPTLLLAEGVLLYLHPAAVTALLTGLAGACAPGSRLALVTAASRPSLRRRAWSVVARLRAEPIRFALAPGQANEFLAGCGWHESARRSGAEMAAELAGTSLWREPLRNADLAFVTCRR